MTLSRVLFALPLAGILVLAVLAAFQGPSTRTPTAWAGPCALPPELFDDGDDPFEDDPLESIWLFATEGGSYYADFLVFTDPPELPPGKDPVTIQIIDIDGHDGIDWEFLPPDSDGIFGTTLFVDVGTDVPPGVYRYEIEIYCHERTRFVDFDIYVAACTIGPFTGWALPQGASPTPSSSPFPDECEVPSPTPVETPTPTPTSSPTTVPSETPVPTPSAPPLGQGVIWGDMDCDDEITTRDNQALLRNVLTQAPLSQQIPCPFVGAILRFFSGFPNAVPAGELPTGIWGDTDCDGAVTTRDNQALLRRVLGQTELSQTEPCPDLGAEVAVDVVDG